MVSIDQIEDYVRRRIFTDYVMPIWLPFIPVALSIFAVLSIFFFVFTTPHYSYEYPMYGALTFSFILGITATAINVYVVYKWVWRRNEHFKRQRLLFTSVKDYLKSKGFEVGRLESICMEMEVEEGEKNAVLWALAQFIPYIGGILLIYVYHFLNKDFYRHEKREDFFLSTLSSLIPNFNYVRYSEIPDRSTILYLILSIVTFGIFTLYWVYTLTKDPNEHFFEHRRWEDRLVEVLKTF